MKTLLPLSLLALTVAYPLVLAADIFGVHLPAFCDAVNFLVLYLGIGLGLIILHSYEEKPADSRRRQAPEPTQGTVQLRTPHHA